MDKGLVTGRHKRPRQGTWFLLVLILAAFALRTFNLGGPELWFDETLSANISAMGWAGALAHVRGQAFEHPPVYYLALNAWQSLAGTSEFALRFFSVLWGVLYVPLLYQLARRLTQERVARLAALLAALSPFMVAYSQEARMYTLLACLAVLFLLAFHQALQHGNRPGWWLAYGLLLATGVATQYYFALLWLGTSLFMIVEWRRQRRVAWWAVAVQALILAGATAWLLAAPGLRASLVRLAQGEAAFSLDYKFGQVMPGLLVGEAGGQQLPLVALILAGAGWLLTLWGMASSRTSPWVVSRAWGLLVVCLAVPVVASLAIPYGVTSRHLDYTLAAILIFMALGLVTLRHRGRLWLAVGILFVLPTFAYGLVTYYTAGRGDFRQALAYIDARAQPGDLLILTQPAHRHLMAYYNRKGWPVLYLPEEGVSLTSAAIRETLRALGQTHSRVWLGPVGAWTADPDSLVEQWLTSKAHQAEKAWFSEGSSAALYFMPKPLETQPLDGTTDWEARLRLLSAQRSADVVAPGNALRLSLAWQTYQPIESSYQVVLELVDELGQVWATRRSEPCGGLCPTPTWRPGVTVQDRHALLIPPGTPPGRYRLRAGWYVPSEGRLLSSTAGGQQVDLGGVQVSRARRASLDAASASPVLAEFGRQIALQGFELDEQDLRAGQTLDLSTSWLALNKPSRDVVALLELIGPDGQVHASGYAPPSASFFPSSEWRAGESVRGIQRLSLPNRLKAGRYRLRLSLLYPNGRALPVSGSQPHQALGGLIRWQTALQGDALDLTSVRVSERPRSFALPAMDTSSPAQFDQGVELLGYDLDTSTAVPGGEVVLTAYWRAGGPTDGPHKVFVHLGDGKSSPAAQDDGPPGGGCCPTDTWTEGEIIVDRHTVSLPADVPARTYWLIVGLYDETSGQRLAVADAGELKASAGQLFLTQVAVRPSDTPVPLPVRFALPYHAYLPLIEVAP